MIGYTGPGASGGVDSCLAGSCEPGGGVISPANVQPASTAVEIRSEINPENLNMQTLYLWNIGQVNAAPQRGQNWSAP